MALHSRPIAATLIIDGAALMLYNVAGMRVTGHAGAVFRTVLETSRTLFVWLVDLALFYGGAGGGTLGESWSKWSFVQAAGFGVMVAGTLVYGAGDDADAAAALAAGGGELPPTAGPAGVAAPGTVARPAPARRTTAPHVIGTPSSFKPTMNIHTFSSSYVAAASSFAAPAGVSPDV